MLVPSSFSIEFEESGGVGSVAEGSPGISPGSGLQAQRRVPTCLALPTIPGPSGRPQSDQARFGRTSKQSVDVAKMGSWMWSEPKEIGG